MKQKVQHRPSRLALLAKAKSRARLRLNQLPPEEALRRVNYFPAKDWKLIHVPAWPSAHGGARAH
jgi:hypothetical protein